MNQKHQFIRRTRPSHVLRVGALIVCAFLAGRLIVWAQVWSGPASQPPVNNPGQPPTIPNADQYLRKSPATTQVLQGAANAASISSVPAQLASPNISVLGRNSFALPSFSPAGNTGIYGYATGTAYGVFGFGDGSGTSYGIFGQVNSAVGTAGYFYGPARVSGSAIGKLEADSAVTANNGLLCSETLGCIVEASTNALQGTHTAGGYSVYGYSVTQPGVSISLDHAATQSVYPVEGSSSLGYGIGGRGPTGILGAIVSKNPSASLNFIGVEGFARDATNLFRQRYGVQGVSIGGLGNQLSYSATVPSYDLVSGVRACVKNPAGAVLNANGVKGAGGRFAGYFDGVCTGSPCTPQESGDGGHVIITGGACTQPPTLVSTLDGPNDVGYGSSIVIGSDGYPVMSYFDNTADDIKVAKCRNADCTSGVALSVAAGGANPIYQQSSIAIGAGGNPVVSYFDNVAQQVRLVMCSDAACSVPPSGSQTTRLIASVASFSVNSYVVVDSSNVPVIAYIDTSSFPYSLKVIRCTDALCTGVGAVQTIDTGVGAYVSMTTDASGNPVISYVKTGVPDTLYVAHCADAPCSSSTKNPISAASNPHIYTDIALDSGKPVVSYYDTSLKHVKVARCIDANCLNPATIGTADSTSVDKVSPNIAIGPDHRPVLSYVAFGAALQLWVSKCNDTNCTGAATKNLDSATAVGQFTGLAVVGNLPVVDYYASVSGDFRVAKCTNASCTEPCGSGTCTEPAVKILHAAGNNENYTSLTIGSDTYPIMSYFSQGDSALYVIHCRDKDCAGIDRRDLDGGPTSPVGDVGAYSSIAINPLDGNLPIISYQDYVQLNLKVARCADIACSTLSPATPAVVDGDSSTPPKSLDVGQYSSIAIGTTDGLPVISYHDSTAGDLKVVKCDNVSCSSINNTITNVDQTGDVGEYSAIAVGTDNLPVISYYESSALGGAGDLKVVKCGNASCSAAGGYTFFKPDTLNDVGRWISMALLQPGNVPLISYYDVTNGDLKVVRCPNIGQPSPCDAPTTVYSYGDVGQYTSIKIGTDGLPIISFYDVTNQNLEVVKCGNVTCSANNIFASIDGHSDQNGKTYSLAGRYTDIAIGADGFPVMSYLAESVNPDLRFAACTNASCTRSCTSSQSGGAANPVLRIGPVYLTKPNLKGLLCKAGFIQYCP